VLATPFFRRTPREEKRTKILKLILSCSHTRRTLFECSQIKIADRYSLRTPAGMNAYIMSPAKRPPVTRGVISLESMKNKVNKHRLCLCNNSRIDFEESCSRVFFVGDNQDQEGGSVRSPTYSSAVTPSVPSLTPNSSLRPKGCGPQFCRRFSRPLPGYPFRHGLAMPGSSLRGSASLASYCRRAPRDPWPLHLRRCHGLCTVKYYRRRGNPRAGETPCARVRSSSPDAGQRLLSLRYIRASSGLLS
jgi:hypothetical protein